MNTLHRIVLGCAAASLCVLVASCSSTAEGPTIEIRDGAWSAVPSTLEAGGGSFRITVVNLGDQRREFAVVSLTGAKPDGLPVVDGLLDVSLEGSTFFVAHPDYERREGDGVAPRPLVPDTIDPGEEKLVTIGTFKGGGEPGTYVVLACEPGGYEAGEYAAFTIMDR